MPRTKLAEIGTQGKRKVEGRTEASFLSRKREACQQRYHSENEHLHLNDYLFHNVKCILLK